MGFYRNPEIRKELPIWALCSIVATVAGFLLGNPPTGAGVLALCLFFCGLHLYVSYRRYQKIADLSHEIDRILNDAEHFDLSKFAEGELAVLESELHKMTMRLREQADALQKDKTYLADSIADISHQIRTPLTSINLLVQFLSEPDLETEQKNHLIVELNGLLARIDWLVNTLLKMSRLDAGTLSFEPKSLAVREVIAKAYQVISVPMDLRNQEFQLDCHKDLRIEVDLERTAEALTNIMKNAMEHMTEGGIIRVQVSENAIYTKICIQDNGSGIPTEDIGHVFERFYRGKNATESSAGIGLAFARRIVTSQNGTIKVINLPQGGTSFEIRFYKTIV